MVPSKTAEYYKQKCTPQKAWWNNEMKLQTKPSLEKKLLHQINEKRNYIKSLWKHKIPSALVH